jgi:hypothetical protein
VCYQELPIDLVFSLSLVNLSFSQMVQTCLIRGKNDLHKLCFEIELNQSCTQQVIVYPGEIMKNILRKTIIPELEAPNASSVHRKGRMPIVDSQ